VAAAVFVDIIQERERRGERERKEARREAVRVFAFLLALAVEEAGLALSNAEAVRGELEHVAAMAVRWRSEHAWALHS
jgi:hypothetical protein